MVWPTNFPPSYSNSVGNPQQSHKLELWSQRLFDNTENQDVMCSAGTAQTIEENLSEVVFIGVSFRLLTPGRRGL